MLCGHMTALWHRSLGVGVQLYRLGLGQPDELSSFHSLHGLAILSGFTHDYSLYKNTTLFYHSFPSMSFSGGYAVAATAMQWESNAGWFVHLRN